MLRADGHYLLLTFNALELNPIPKTANDAVNALFPDHPFDYMERGPFCYADPARIKDDPLAAAFTNVKIETINVSSRVNARDAAQALVLGSPFRSEIERRGPSALERAVQAVSEALLPWDGKDAPISAHLVTAGKSAAR